MIDPETKRAIGQMIRGTCRCGIRTLGCHDAGRINLGTVCLGG